MSTTEVLNQIEEALDDWAVGPDAMRSGADPSTVRGGLWLPPAVPVFATPPVDLSGYLAVMNRTAAAMADVFARMPTRPRNRDRYRIDRLPPGRVIVGFDGGWRGGDAMVVLMDETHSFLLTDLWDDCRMSTPPLCIDGHAYRRRTRGRRGRS